MRERSPGTWVLWLYASSLERFELSVRDTADRPRVPERDKPNANTFRLFRNWLRDHRNGKWLLILDSVDDADFLLEPSSRRSGEQGSDQPLIDCLPTCDHGSILITSRSQNAAFKLVDDRDIIEVQQMEEKCALALLERNLGHQENNTYMAASAMALDSMPLAITQAATLLRQRAPRYSVRQYIEMLEKIDKSKQNLLDRNESDLRRDREAKNSILLTWQISFEHIQEIRPSAAQLLSLMSICDRHGIPECLLRIRTSEDNDTGSSGRIFDEGNEIVKNEDSSDHESEAGLSMDDLDNGFEDDITTLRQYSFISDTTDIEKFEMHRLVQLASRRWLVVKGNLQPSLERLSDNLCQAFDNSKYENWSKCEALFPHVKSTMKLKPESSHARLQLAAVLYRAADYAWSKGTLVDADAMSSQSLDVRQKLLGHNNKQTLMSMEMVALAKSLAGHCKEASKLEKEVLDTRKTLLGEDHPGTLVSLDNLAYFYDMQGCWRESEELSLRAVEKMKTEFGVEHRNTLLAVNSLGLNYKRQKRWAETERLQSQVVDMAIRQLGDEHPNTLLYMSNLAATYQYQERWKEAEELEATAMEMSNKVLTPEHPDTLTSMCNLAATYWSQGRLAEAEMLEREVMETRRAVLGEQHPDTLHIMAGLAHTLRSQGRTQVTLELMSDCVTLSTKVLGAGHPDTKHRKRLLDTWTSQFNSRL